MIRAHIQMKSTVLNLKQHGVALGASLSILLFMTRVAISIVRGSTLCEKIAGNTREKQRAIQSAKDAALYAEWWLTQTANYSIASNPIDCSTNKNPPTTPVVCNADPNASTGPLAANISALKANSLFSYTLPCVQWSTNSGGGGIVSQSCASANNVGDVLYSAKPQIYINNLPSIGSELVFRITTIGYGGSGGKYGTQAIVQEVYALNNSSGSGGSIANNSSLGGQ